MNCTRLQNHLDDYVDGTLEPATAQALHLHSETCDECQRLLSRERKLRSLLGEYADASMPEPGDAYFDRLLVQAAREGRKQQHTRSWLTGFGSALAAGLAIWVVSITIMTGPVDTPVDSAIPTVAMSIEEPRTVNLVFSSASELDHATLTVLLPEGVQIAGFEGQQEITWSTSLNEGKNVLPLQLIAAYPTSGELLATLRHGEDDRTFRLRVDVI